MEENKPNLTEEERTNTTQKQEPLLASDSIEFESNAIGIKTITTGIDKESPIQTDILSSKVNLTAEQKAEVKELFKSDFENSVQTLKDDIKKEGQEIKKDFLTIFGLFASFVTFLSIEVQVFKNKDNILELIGISSISLSFVMFFALIINDIAKDKQDWKDYKKPSYFLNAMFLIVGITFLLIGGKFSVNQINLLESKSSADSIEINSLKQNVQQLTNQVQHLDSLIKKQKSLEIAESSTTDKLQKVGKIK